MQFSNSGFGFKNNSIKRGTRNQYVNTAAKFRVWLYSNGYPTLLVPCCRVFDEEEREGERENALVVLPSGREGLKSTYVLPMALAMVHLLSLAVDRKFVRAVSALIQKKDGEPPGKRYTSIWAAPFISNL